MLSGIGDISTADVGLWDCLKACFRKRWTVVKEGDERLRDNWSKVFDPVYKEIAAAERKLGKKT